jgi:uncharacterized membrane protein
MNLKQIIISAIAMLLLDFVYLSGFSKFFNDLVTSIQGTKIKFNPVGAILCYILLIGGLNYFIIARRKSLQEAFILGIVIYGVYETTNLTILSKWSPKAVALDTLWGGILFALTTKITYMLTN